MQNDNIFKILKTIFIPAGILKNVLDSVKYYVIRDKKEKFNDFLPIVAMIKNEAPYIQEWIEYHKLLGITKF